MKNLTKTALLSIGIIFLCFACQEEPIEKPSSSEMPIAESLQSENNHSDSQNIEANFTVDDNDLLITNSTVHFYNNSKGAIAYEWTFGDGQKSELENPSVIYTEEGNYTVELTAITAVGEKVSFKKEIELHDEKDIYNVLLFIDTEASTLNKFDLSTEEFSVLYEIPFSTSGALAYDKENKLVYYTEYGNNKIWRNNLEGSNQELVAEDYLDVRDLVIDSKNNSLYFSAYSSFKVNILNTNSLTIKDVIPTYSAGTIQDMDLMDGKLYTVTPLEGFETVHSVDLINSLTALEIGYEEGGYGYGLAVNPLTKDVYYNDVERSSIMKFNIKDKELQSVVQLDKYRSYGIAVDPLGKRLFWTDWGRKLGIANLDGSAISYYPLNGYVKDIVPVRLD